MNTDDARFNRRLVLLIFASFVVFAIAVILRLGLGATPYDTTNSAGDPMGFNDRLNREHYLIMVQNFDPTKLLNREFVYEWILIAAHVIGAALLIGCGSVCSRSTRWFFAAQSIVFPLGLVALPFMPLVILNLLTGTDREGFVDIPFILVVSQPVWLITATAIAVALRGRPIGLSRVWSALRQATRAGFRAFGEAMR